MPLRFFFANLSLEAELPTPPEGNNVPVVPRETICPFWQAKERFSQYFRKKTLSERAKSATYLLVMECVSW